MSWEISHYRDMIHRLIHLYLSLLHQKSSRIQQIADNHIEQDNFVGMFSATEAFSFPKNRDDIVN